MKNVFSIGLYKEGIKRTRALTIGLLIVALAWVTIPFASNAHDFLKYGEENSIPYNTVLSVTSYVLPVFAYVMGAGLAYAGFSFLRKRNESDFWHAIPYSRTTLYISTALACITQMLIVIAAVLAVPAIGSPIIGMKYEYGLMLRAFISSFASTLLVFGVATFAMAITGTVFSNIILTGIVLFLPRFMLTIAGLLTESETMVAGLSNLGWFIDPGINIPAGTVFTMLKSAEYLETIYASFAPAAYSFVLALLYIALGGWLFSARKSEMAANSAPNEVLQTVYRCAVGLVFALVLTAFMITGDLDVSSFFILLAMSVIPFMLFELITRKSFRAVLKAMPSYGFVILACILFFIGTRIMTTAVLSFTPDADAVNSVQIDNFYYGDSSSIKQYMLSKVKVTSPDVKQILTDSLKENVKRVKKDKNSYYSGVMISVVFNMNDGRKVERLIVIDPKDTDKLAVGLRNDEAYTLAAQYMPTYDELWLCRVNGLDDRQTKALWDTYISEIREKNYSPDDIMNGEYNGSVSYYEADPIFTFVTVYNAGGRLITDTYAVYASTFPKTASAYIREYSTGDRAQENIDTWNAVKAEGIANARVSGTLAVTDIAHMQETAEKYKGKDYDPVYGFSNSIYIDPYEGTNTAGIYSMLDRATVANGSTQTTVMLDGYAHDGNDYFIVFLDLTAEDYETLVMNMAVGVEYFG